MRKLLLLLVAASLVGCGALSKSKQTVKPPTYIEEDMGGYVIAFAGLEQQCPGAGFVDCDIRWHQGYAEIHIDGKDGAAWLPIAGAVIVGQAHH